MNERERWIETSTSGGSGSDGPVDGSRVPAARAEVDAAFQSVSDAAARRVLSRDHEAFLGSVRQSSGQ